MNMNNMRPLLVNHWFLVAAPIVVLVNAVVANAGPITRLVEFGLIFDLVILLPALYLICYRKRRRNMGIRAIGLACLGVWIATKLVPEPERAMLMYIEPLRYAGIAVLVLLQLAVVRLIYSSLAAGDTTAQAASKAQDASDMPPWVARLMAWEAGFWRRLFSAVTRPFRRDRHDD